MSDEKPLGFEGLESWLQARLGQSIDVHIVTERSTVGFVRGPTDRVMRFESDGSRGLIVDGGAGGWSLELAAKDLVSAFLFPVPDGFTAHQLMITMRQHRLILTPADAAAP